MVACDGDHRRGMISLASYRILNALAMRLCSESEGLFFEGREPQLRFIRRVTFTVLAQDSRVVR